MGAVFSAMKAEYVVVAEQAHPLGPAYSITSKHETWYSDVVPLWVVHRHVKNFVNNVLLVK